MQTYFNLGTSTTKYILYIQQIFNNAGVTVPYRIKGGMENFQSFSCWLLLAIVTLECVQVSVSLTRR